MCAKLSDFLPSGTDKEKDDSLNLRDNLDKYLYHWPLFLIGLLIALLGAFFYVQSMQAAYEIKATLLIKDKMKTPEEKSSLDELNISDAPKLAESEIEVLNSRNLVLQVVKDLNLWVTYQVKDGISKHDLYKNSPVIFKLTDSSEKLAGQRFKIKIKDSKSFSLETSNGDQKDFRFGQYLENNFGTWKLDAAPGIAKAEGKELTIIVNDPNYVAQQYQKGIEAVLINKLAPAIGLTLKDQIAQRGKDILNDLIRNYNINNKAEKNHVTQNTLDFIEKRIGSIAYELNHDEIALEKYRSKNGVTSISLQSKAYLDNVKDNDDKLNSVNVQLNIIQNIEKYLNTSQNVQSASAALGATYPALNSLIEKLSVLQLQREKLLATTPEKNPAFEPIERQISSAKTEIRENIENIKTSLESAKEKLQSYNVKFESSIRDIPGQERELIDKTRQKDIKENLYTYLLQKREEISMSYAATLSDAQVVDYAYANSSGSKKPGVYAAAFALGLFLPFVFISVRNKLNNRITTSKEIEQAIGASLFAELSYAKSSTELIVNDKRNVIIGEEFRTLRTHLNILKGSKMHKGMTVLLTSSIAGEGKSFISSNLGFILAASGKKTIVLEMDLRRPKILGFFNIPPGHPGISDYLHVQATKEAIIQHTAAHPILHVIGSGASHDEPTELLGLEELDSLILWLRTKYDFIIIDSPPVNLVTDAKILSRFCDATLYVIRQAYTYQSLLAFIKGIVRDQKLPELKFIFNAVEKGRYGYGHYYGNEYYKALGSKKSTLLGFNNFFRRF